MSQQQQPVDSEQGNSAGSVSMNGQSAAAVADALFVRLLDCVDKADRQEAKNVILDVSRLARVSPADADSLIQNPAFAIAKELANVSSGVGKRGKEHVTDASGESPEPASKRLKKTAVAEVTSFSTLYEHAQTTGSSTVSVSLSKLC
jgi:hypothetical protein